MRKRRSRSAIDASASCEGSGWRPPEGRLRETIPAEAGENLKAALAELRSTWPRDRYWDSFHAELSELIGALLEKVFDLNAGGFVAVEALRLRGATIPLAAGRSLAIDGRMDVALLDRPTWTGATVDIVDFKTGSDARLLLDRMARQEASLQLGTYLAAGRSLGAVGGRTWMLKPDAGDGGVITMEDLPRALALLERLDRHLKTGRFGALDTRPHGILPRFRVAAGLRPDSALDPGEEI